MSEKHAASKVSATQPAEPTVVEKPRWRQNVESIGLALLIALAVRSSVVQAFWVPSGSMLPTIQIGDHIFVNKLAYAVRVPLIGTEIVKVGDLHRDDVVVFVSPVDPSTDLIKRVIAVPGDTVEYHVIKMARKKNMWWFRGEAKVAGHVVAEAEVGAMVA